jgi:hypothetical protein
MGTPPDQYNAALHAARLGQTGAQGIAASYQYSRQLELEYQTNKAIETLGPHFILLNQRLADNVRQTEMTGRAIGSAVGLIAGAGLALGSGGILTAPGMVMMGAGAGLGSWIGGQLGQARARTRQEQYWENPAFVRAGISTQIREDQLMQLGDFTRMPEAGTQAALLRRFIGEKNWGQVFNPTGMATQLGMGINELGGTLMTAYGAGGVRGYNALMKDQGTDLISGAKAGIYGTAQELAVAISGGVRAGFTSDQVKQAARQLGTFSGEAAGAMISLRTSTRLYGTQFSQDKLDKGLMSTELARFNPALAVGLVTNFQEGMGASATGSEAGQMMAYSLWKSVNPNGSIMDFMADAQSGFKGTKTADRYSVAMANQLGGSSAQRVLMSARTGGAVRPNMQLTNTGVIQTLQQTSGGGEIVSENAISEREASLVNQYKRENDLFVNRAEMFDKYIRDTQANWDLEAAAIKNIIDVRTNYTDAMVEITNGMIGAMKLIKDYFDNNRDLSFAPFAQPGGLPRGYIPLGSTTGGNPVRLDAPPSPGKVNPYTGR